MPLDPGGLPKVFRVRQVVRGPLVEDVASAVEAGLSALCLAERVRRGETVAVSAGSRGITDLLPALRAVVAHLGGLGASPFVVPAMGSHGGATARGQEEVLERYGVTEAAVGAPVRSSMEVVKLGTSKLGVPLFQDRLAASADHVVVVNRVKPHTMFSGRWESGLIKMLMFGLGKQRGAEACHRAAMDHGWDTLVLDAGRELLGLTRVLAGVALVEREDDRTARVEVLAPECWLEEEPGLLEEARRLLLRVPFEDLDLLLLDRIGKDISGAGLDVNALGRKSAVHPPTWERHGGVRLVAVRGLTSATHGNALGLGLAELCRSRVVAAMDRHATRVNALTAGDLAAAMLPVDFETDAEILSAALELCGQRPPGAARLLWAADTLQLKEVMASEALLAEAEAREDLEVLGEAVPLPLDSAGNLPDDLPADLGRQPGASRGSDR